MSKENKADDDRNSKMSELAEQNSDMRQSLINIRDAWINCEKIDVKTMNEIVLKNSCMEMAEMAAIALLRSPAQ